MTYKIVRSEEKIDEQPDRVIEALKDTELPGLSYEDGVEATIRWLTDLDFDPPIKKSEESSQNFIQKLAGNLRDTK